jgi:PAS domain S-box-containing protein
MAFDLVLSTMFLRLACQIANDSAGVRIAVEALLVGIPAAVLLSGDTFLASLWTLSAFGFAGVQVTRMPHRSWDGFRIALYTVSVLMWTPALPILASLAGASVDLTSTGTSLVLTILAIGLFLRLPRLGLLSSDRVRHSSVIEAMCDGVLVVDMNDRLVEFNDAAREILELDEGALSLRHIADVLSHHPDLVELFSGAIDGQSVYSIDHGCEQVEKKTYDLRLSALYDSTGSIRSRVMVLRDISDRIAIEEESRRQSRHVRLVHEVSAVVHEASTIEAGLEAALSLIAKTMNYSLGHFLRAESAAGSGQLVASGIVYIGDRDGDDSISRDRDPADAMSGLEPREESGHDGSLTAAVDPRGVHWWKERGAANLS